MSDRRRPDMLKGRCATRGWTRAELAERAGVARKRGNAIERAHFAFSDVLSPGLAGLFGTRVHELFQLPAWPAPRTGPAVRAY